MHSLTRSKSLISLKLVIKSVSFFLGHPGIIGKVRENSVHDLPEYECKLEWATNAKNIIL